MKNLIYLRTHTGVELIDKQTALSVLKKYKTIITNYPIGAKSIEGEVGSGNTITLRGFDVRPIGSPSYPNDREGLFYYFHGNPYYCGTLSQYDMSDENLNKLLSYDYRIFISAPENSTVCEIKSDRKYDEW